MARFCSACGREKRKPHVCDLVTLTDGRKVHAERVAIGGDVHDELGDGLKVVHRNITPEMRKQMDAN